MDDLRPNRRVCTSCATLEKLDPDEALPCEGCSKDGVFVTPAEFRETYPTRIFIRYTGKVGQYPTGGHRPVDPAPARDGPPMWQILSAVFLCFLFPPFLLVLIVWALARVAYR